MGVLHKIGENANPNNTNEKVIRENISEKCLAFLSW